MEGEIVENIPRAGEKFFTKQFTSENIYAIMYLVKIWQPAPTCGWKFHDELRKEKNYHLRR